MHIFSFEKLDVWKNAIDLAVDVYKSTGVFPKEELYVLTSQLRRASVSVSSNIAEGNSRETNTEKARFTTVSYSSLMEVLNQLIIANKLDYISDDELSKYRDKISLISNQLNNLKKYQINRKK